jgi:hypothetical protein
LLIAVCLCGALLQGCGNSSNNNASVRVLNLISGASGINVTVGGTTILSGAGFETIGNYSDVGGGTQQFKVTIAGNVGTLIDVAYGLSSGITYTFVIAGTPGAAAGILLAEAYSPPPGANFALQVLTTSLAAGAIDVYLTAPGADLGTTNPTVVAATVGTVKAFTNVPVGNWELRLTPTGTKTVIYDATPPAFAQGSGQTIVAYSKGSGTLVNVVVLASGSAGTIVNSQLANFKVANGTAVASPLNVLVDGTPAFANLAFASVTGYQALAAGARAITVEAAATPGAPLLTTNHTFVPATDTSIGYSGAAGSLAALTLADSNPFIALGRAQLRIVNLSPDFAAVDVYGNFGKIASGLATGTASAYALVDATAAGATYQFDFNAAGTTTVVYSLPGQVIADTHDYTVYLVGSGPTLKGVLTQDR